MVEGGSSVEGTVWVGVRIRGSGNSIVEAEAMPGSKMLVLRTNGYGTCLALKADGTLGVGENGNGNWKWYAHFITRSSAFFPIA